MEVDEHQLPNPILGEKSQKRFGLRNSIQTNFGDDYVFEITPKYAASSRIFSNLVHEAEINTWWSNFVLRYERFDWTLMGVSLSTNAVKLYSPETGQFCGECRGHTATINRISFSGPSGPHVLHSCSSDGTIRAWDTRTFKEVGVWSYYFFWGNFMLNAKISTRPSYASSVRRPILE